MSKPAVFVGSSTQGLDFARAVRTGLSDAAEVTLWNEGFFAPNSTFIETLVNNLDIFDFGVMVLTADDLVRSKEVESIAPRDNVIFELGLFMGRLGRARTFMIRQSGADLKIPTDLAGVTAAVFEWPRQDGRHEGAVGVACDSIRRVIVELGASPKKTAQAITEIKARQAEHEAEMARQRTQIRSLQFAMQGIVTQFEYAKLVGLQAPEPFICYYSDEMFDELKRLRAMGLVIHHQGTGLAHMKSLYKDRNAQFDLKQFFRITDQGIEYLRLRAELVDGEES